jgi:hypothetical protein
MKMLIRYPSLSADWLLFGRGQMFRERTIGDLFDSNDLSRPVGTYKPHEQPFNESVKAPEELPGNVMEIQIGQGKNPEFGKAKRIICFFENNTFKEYFPAKE